MWYNNVLLVRQIAEVLMDNTGIGEKIKKRPNLAAILLCASGVILNLTLSNLIDLFHLPLYFDTAGTVAVAIEDLTTITDDEQKVFVALSGDQVALTDIRVE